MVGLFVLPLPAEELCNPSFEQTFGGREDQNVWGQFGNAFGECYQVEAANNNGPGRARTGSNVLLINVPQNSWNGLWQQIPWGENLPFAWKAYYLIKDGDLPTDCATFMKAEFLDGMDNKLGEISGAPKTQDTQGNWVMDSLRGQTPAHTRSIRFVLIAGHNPDGESVINRIYWDDANTLK